MPKETTTAAERVLANNRQSRHFCLCHLGQHTHTQSPVRRGGGGRGSNAVCRTSTCIYLHI